MRGPGELYEKLYDIIKVLRSPEGCPWDREQTPASLLPNLVEESYELAESVQEKEVAGVREELGDLFLLVTMIGFMYEEDGGFSVAEAIEGVVEKLTRRHPHVFGRREDLHPERVIERWEQIKMGGEGKKPRESVFDGVPRALPPLEKAVKIQKKVSRVGFDWDDHQGVVAKIREEVAELEEAVGEGVAARIEEEVGDLLFSVANLARFLGVDPSSSLARTNRRFERRFRFVEAELRSNGLAADKANRERMEEAWERSKRLETETDTASYRS